MQHLNPKLAWTIFIVAVLIVFGVVGIYYWNFSKEEPKTTISVSTTKPTSSPTTTSTTTPTPTATTDETAGWKTYTNPDYGYSIKYPTSWTVAQGKVLEEGVTESVKNMNIVFSDAGKERLKIKVDAKTKFANMTLVDYTKQSITPADKATITGKESYKVGDVNGYKELVTISDPASKGLYYFADNSKYFLTFITSETSASAEMVKVLSTFKFTS